MNKESAGGGKDRESFSKERVCVRKKSVRFEV